MDSLRRSGGVSRHNFHCQHRNGTSHFSLLTSRTSPTRLPGFTVWPRCDAGRAGTYRYRGINVPRTPVTLFAAMERTLRPLGSGPRAKCPANATLTPRAGVRTRVRIATGGFRPPAQKRGKRGGQSTEPQGGSPRVKCPGNAMLTPRAGAAPQGAKSQPGASARPLRSVANVMARALSRRAAARG
ncbi:MAG: hypothetical protein RLZZ436_729 [Planctomycetota bacterium]